MKNTCYGIFVVSVILLVSSFATAGEVTELSKKASRLKMGMTREAVIRLLGSATWASIPGDKGEFAPPDPRIGLELFWRNPGFTPVAVDFDRNLKVIGWDTGQIPLQDYYLVEPTDKYSCTKPDRSKYCGVKKPTEKF